MFAVRCLSNRILPQTRLLPYSCRYLSAGAANAQMKNEQHQSTINVIKEDLQLIHRDILQVSKTIL